MKKTNKGFSLVELIIVIAIMAILAGAIAPALIKYIDKSRKSNDVSSAKTVKTAIETALGTESIYEYLTSGDAADASKFNYVYIAPGKSCAEAEDATTTITIKGPITSGEINGKTAADLKKAAQNAIGSNIGESSPKIKYRKNAAKKTKTPTEFVGVISGKGTVYVFVSVETAGTMTVTADSSVGATAGEKGFQLAPNLCDEYQ